MKFQFLTSYYPPFLNSFYSKFPQYEHMSYDEMLALLLNQYFADTGAAHHHIIKHRHESFIIISNCEPLQKKWAREHGFEYGTNWQKEIAAQQIKVYKPDVFYLESVFEYFGDFVSDVKPYCKIIVSWISTPFSSQLPLNGIDLFLSSTPDFVDSFKKQGYSAEYMLPAFDERILNVIGNPVQKTIPFSFVGGWSDIHINRKEALIQLVENTEIQLWGYGFKKEYSKRQFKYYRNLILPYNKKVLEHYNGEVWGLEMYDVLQKSLLTFNIHEALLKGNVGNMRMFEASGVGTLLINDDGHNLSKLFEKGKEIESYRTIPEAIEKVNYYLAHPQKAIEMGKAAQARTLSDYNYDVYVTNLVSYIEKYISNA